MSDEEQPTIEELEAEYRDALNKKVDFLKSDNEARENADEELRKKKEADALEAEKLQEKEDIKKESMAEFGLTPVVQDPTDPPVAPDTKNIIIPSSSVNKETMFFSIPFILGSLDFTDRYYGSNSAEMSIRSGNANLIIRSIPEPETMILGGIFLIAMAAFRRKKFFKD